MVSTLAQILQWFQTGDRPTQAEFESTWNSFQHVDDYVVEVFDYAQLTGGFADVTTTLPNPTVKSDADIHRAVQVFEGKGTMLPLDNDVPFGFRINVTLNNIELLDRDGTSLRVPPVDTRLVVKINKKYV